MIEENEFPKTTAQVDFDAVTERLIYIRKRLGYNKTDFAKSIGITKSNYGQIENRKRKLSVDQIYRIFVVHSVPMEYLLAGQVTNLPEKLR